MERPSNYSVAFENKTISIFYVEQNAYQSSNGMWQCFSGMEYFEYSYKHTSEDKFRTIIQVYLWLNMCEFQ